MIHTGYKAPFFVLSCFVLHRKYYASLNIIIKDPIKIPTPYGGKLEWELPSGNRLIAHLKDKAKIRHKKRWSQVGHQLLAQFLLIETLTN